jgi:2-dehydro-3-deoxygluconokinase
VGSQPDLRQGLIVSIGEPMVEFNQTRRGERAYLQGFGGDTSNMIIAAARSGARTAYVTRVGDDEFGRRFLELWTDEGVSTRGVTIDRKAPTGAYFVSHSAQGHTFSYLRAGSAASRLEEADLPHFIDSAAFVHASAISMAISSKAGATVLAAFERARRAGVQVAFDANLRLRLWSIERARAAIAAAAALTDYFFPSIEDARPLSGEEDAEANLDWAHALGPKHVFLKLGDGGVLVSDGRQRELFSGHKVNAVDATGAGDCFCGAALARLAAGDSIRDAARYANAAAALATTGYGAVDPLPRPDAVRKLI